MGKSWTAPTTSVAMATYNGARFIEEQLDSIARQSHPVDEVVIADDCSSDETLAIVERSAARLGLAVRILTGSQRLGVVANFERALLACRGDLVFLCDQDDIWYQHKVDRIVSEFVMQPDTLAVFTDAVVVDKNRKPLSDSLLSLSRLNSEERVRIRGGDAFSVLMTRNVATGATMAVRSTLIPIALPTPSGWFHDEWLAITASTMGRVSLLDEPTIEYRQHAANTIGAPRPTTFVDKIRSLGKPSRAERLREAERARLLAARFEATASVVSSIKDAAREKSRHLVVRAGLPHARLMRFPAVSRELVNSGYFRYSHGFRAAIRDLLQTMD